MRTPRTRTPVYALNVGVYRSVDGGKTFKQAIAVPHGDNHDLWIAPDDPHRMIEGNDGGATVSMNAGKTWTEENFATAQFYHVTTTNEFPYRICGAQQDNSTLCGPSRWPGGVTRDLWVDAGGGESGYIAVDPLNPNIAYAGSYGGLLTRKNMRTDEEVQVNPWPDNPMGHSARDLDYRFQWTFPIIFLAARSEGALRGREPRLSHDQRWTELGGDLSRSHAPRSPHVRPRGRADHEGPDGRRDVRDDLYDRRVAAGARGDVDGER